MKRIIAAAILVLAMVLSGCMNRIDTRLPDDPIEFHTSTFVNPADGEDDYTAYEYEGRTYIPYGTTKDSLGAGDVGACLGYRVQDGEKMEDLRLFPLTANPDANYLVEMQAGGMMDQPFIYRATDTVGQDIATPSFIESLGYDYWK